MKTSRMYVSLFAVILAIASSSFTGTNSGQIYFFTGNSSNLFDPNQYVSAEPPGLCQQGSDVACSIRIPEPYTDKADFLEAAAITPSLLSDATQTRRAQQ